jgi:hypothetical protein
VTGIRHLTVLLLTLGVALAGCAERGAPADTAAGEDDVQGRSSGGLVVVPREPYQVAPVQQPGRLVGTIEMVDALPTEGQGGAGSGGGCEATDAPVRSAADLMTVVWAEGVRRGKALPADRRYQLTLGQCEGEPRVQAVVAGGMLNIFHGDRQPHRIVLMRAGTSDTLQVLPFTLPGQLVPSSVALRTPGIVEVRCAEHQWAHAWVAVFDHPYVAVGEPGATFAMDSLPAGRVRLMAWREGDERPRALQADVAAGGESTIVVK